MPKFLIERDVPGIGRKSHQEMQDLAQKTLTALESVGPQVHWLESFITDDKVYAVYIAPDEQVLRDLANKVGLPANRISEVHTAVDPSFVDAGKRTQFKSSGTR